MRRRARSPAATSASTARSVALAIRGVEVERRERGRLEMVGRPRQGARGTAAARRSTVCDRCRSRFGRLAYATSRRTSWRNRQTGAGPAFSSRTMISASISSWSSRFARVCDDRDLLEVEVVLIDGQPPGQIALLEGQAVEARGDHRLDRRRDQGLAVLRGSLAQQHAGRFHDEEGVAARAADDGRGVRRRRAGRHRPAARARRPRPRAAARGARRPGSWRPFPTRAVRRAARSAPRPAPAPGPGRDVRGPRSARSGRASAAAACARPRTAT